MSKEKNNLFLHIMGMSNIFILIIFRISLLMIDFSKGDLVKFGIMLIAYNIFLTLAHLKVNGWKL